MLYHNMANEALKVSQGKASAAGQRNSNNISKKIKK
jgi:hypothetical protein